ncbi:MAG: GNAT family N-acetyltransferase [Paludibacter sp.]|nr:GNAT family N-acetyltransferase [Paludibacter sp.]
MKIINCDFKYASEILDIFNEAILNTTALYDYKPWNMEIMKAWFEFKVMHNFPVIGLVDDAGKLMGFGSYGMFRLRPAYKYTVENSVYIHKNYRGKGLGKILLQEIIKNARAQNFHSIIAVIDTENESSIKLHEKYGFKNVGILPQVGYKFGKWLDVIFMQLILETPTRPVEG